MVVNLQYLKKKYLKNFPNNEKLCNFVLTDILFGFSEISQILKKNQKINSVLEIGSGSGILLNELKTFFPHISFIGIDPNKSGYHSYREIYKSLDKREFEVENVQIEKFSTRENFDLIFSINVFEHVEDWKKYIYQTSNLLNDNGLNIIFAPNYDFPYEPHFVIPIIINKKITKFLFNRKIKKSEMCDTGNEPGLWEGLNFIGKRKVEKFLKKNSYPYFFDFSIKNRMLDRIINDNEFKRRQGIGGRIAILAKYFYIDKLIFNLLKIPFPYMKFIINKKK